MCACTCNSTSLFLGVCTLHCVGVRLSLKPPPPHTHTHTTHTHTNSHPLYCFLFCLAVVAVSTPNSSTLIFSMSICIYTCLPCPYLNGATAFSSFWLHIIIVSAVVSPSPPSMSQRIPPPLAVNGLSPRDSFLLT